MVLQLQGEGKPRSYARDIDGLELGWLLRRINNREDTS